MVPIGSMISADTAVMVSLMGPLSRDRTHSGARFGYRPARQHRDNGKAAAHYEILKQRTAPDSVSGTTIRLVSQRPDP
ncbi:hypothetical protein GCM10022231_16500 [Gordonia caeni]|uniref:Uncharacterized protein n=1 Tax=Gordonia caeni TaxID=1007097 RepID=A0ABP7P222_9ACTN